MDFSIGYLKSIGNCYELPEFSIFGLLVILLRLYEDFEVIMSGEYV